MIQAFPERCSASFDKMNDVSCNVPYFHKQLACAAIDVTHQYFLVFAFEMVRKNRTLEKKRKIGLCRYWKKTKL